MQKKTNKNSTNIKSLYPYIVSLEIVIRCTILIYTSNFFFFFFFFFFPYGGGRLGEAKMSCILRHRSVQLILAYSWTRPAILAAGNGGGGMFLFLLFLHFHSFSSSSLSRVFIFSAIFSISFLPVSGR